MRLIAYKPSSEGKISNLSFFAEDFLLKSFYFYYYLLLLLFFFSAFTAVLRKKLRACEKSKP